MTATLLDREDLAALIGQDNQEAMILNHQNHAGFIAAQLAHFQPTVLVETVAWVLRSYQAHGFDRTYWPIQLQAWCHHIREQVPQYADQILPMYRFLNDHLDHFDRLDDDGVAPTH